MKRKHLLVALLLLSATTLSIFSCKKQAATEQMATEQPVNAISIQQLALRYTMPIDKDYPALSARYSSLNPEELKQFWLEINKINRHVESLTQKEQTDILKWVEENNSKSLASFGKPFNKANSTGLPGIAYGSTKEPVSSIKNPPPPPPGDCQLYTYPFDFYPGSSPYYSPAAAFYTDVKDGYYDDPESPYYPCSGLEYSYSGYQWGAMYALTPLAAQCMGYLGGWPWDVRRADGYTKVFAPKRFVAGWFGSFAAFNDNVRVTVIMEE